MNNTDLYMQWQNIWDDVCREEKARETEKSKEEKNDQEQIALHDCWNYYLNGTFLNEDCTANPVYPDSVGEDQVKPDPAWVNEDLLKEIENLKNKLYDMELDLNRKDAGDGEWPETPVVPEHDHPYTNPKTKKILTDIQEMREKISKISDKLGLENEPKYCRK